MNTLDLVVQNFGLWGGVSGFPASWRLPVLAGALTLCLLWALHAYLGPKRFTVLMVALLSWPLGLLLSLTLPVKMMRECEQRFGHLWPWPWWHWFVGCALESWAQHKQMKAEAEDARRRAVQAQERARLEQEARMRDYLERRRQQEANDGRA